ncbi:MAG: helix-hairpin-helix domain-containing protein [Flavobacteriales bacterium]|nr:helix-hairpin-helix domain-containing protein [Flavobacteriales bacterium]MDW8409563.1 helix-hairpin-helix domain-containing protein [Flavobacteriales bacterium]
MTPLKRLLRSITEINQNERRGLLLLTLLLAAIILARHGVGRFLRPSLHVKTEYVLLKELDSLKNSRVDSLEADVWQRHRSQSEPLYNQNRTPSVFPFNPNTLDSAGWVQLGLSPRQTAALLKYRRKGGRFRSAEDLKKLYVVDEDFYQRVAPYIRLDTDSLKPKVTFDSIRIDERHVTKKSFKKVNSQKLVNLNDASASELTRIPGIDEALAQRIIEYRNKVGGFTSVQQLFKIREPEPGFWERVLPYFTVGDFPSPKVNINYATEEELIRLPLIGRTRARALKEARQRDGFFRSLYDLRQRKVLPDSVVDVIQHLIEF